MKTFNKIKWLLLAILTIIILICVPNTCYAQNYSRNGNSFISSSTARVKSEPIKTKFTWQESDGNKYDIYISSTGSCFINKISKNTGKTYRKYLGPDISQEICKELGIEYKGKKSNIKNS